MWCSRRVVSVVSDLIVCANYPAETTVRNISAHWSGNKLTYIWGVFGFDSYGRFDKQRTIAMIDHRSRVSVVLHLGLYPPSGEHLFDCFQQVLLRLTRERSRVSTLGRNQTWELARRILRVLFDPSVHFLFVEVIISTSSLQNLDSQPGVYLLSQIECFDVVFSKLIVRDWPDVCEPLEAVNKNLQIQRHKGSAFIGTLVRVLWWLLDETFLV